MGVQNQPHEAPYHASRTAHPQQRSPAHVPSTLTHQTVINSAKFMSLCGLCATCTKACGACVMAASIVCFMLSSDARRPPQRTPIGRQHRHPPPWWPPQAQYVIMPPLVPPAPVPLAPALPVPVPVQHTAAQQAPVAWVPQSQPGDAWAKGLSSVLRAGLRLAYAFICQR